MSLNPLIRDHFDHSNLALLQASNERDLDLAEEVATLLWNLSAQVKPLDRRLIVQYLTLELPKFILSSNREELKKQLSRCGDEMHWKAGLLNINLKKKLEFYSVRVQYANQMSRPLTQERIKYKAAGDMSAICASTFATNKESRIDDQEHTLLDAVCMASCQDTKGFNGFALALSDGAGGHFGDQQQDMRIAKAARIATKTAVQLMSGYHQAEELIEDFPALIKQVDQAIQSKCGGEGATLVACRAFSIPEGFRIVGINIGDNMLISWNPLTQTFSQLFASHASEAGTAFLPNVYRSFEIQHIDITLPEGTLLFLMSDGVHDTLPFEEKEDLYPNGLKYFMRSLTKVEEILGVIDQSKPVNAYLDALTQKSFQGTEALRQERLNIPESCVGDDFSLAQCHLVKPKSWFQKVLNVFKSEKK
ncbi:MAG: protein phosphatase 2C domain-containing protein [Candidatus Rhabdochlamydia sp.]